MDFIMKVFRYPLLFILACFASTYAQDLSFAEELFENHETYKVAGFQQRRIKQTEVLSAIDKAIAQYPGVFESRIVGTSVQGRPLPMLSFGNGDIDVLMWSQMHGNESTATRAIFDLLHFIGAQQETPQVQHLLNALRIHIIPMLNPDGAQEFQRENALGIDLNRDALRLVSPEAQTLKRVRDSLDADYGFNLHDQSRYYNVERTPKQASISFLATAYNYEKAMNDKRQDAAQLIGYLHAINEKFIPGHTGRYSDDFEPRAFGDNIQLWGTRLILIETGGFPDDREKSMGRKMNYVLIGSALDAVATSSFEQIAEFAYWEIPENDRKLFDLKIEKVQVTVEKKPYVLDLGINFNEVATADSYLLDASLEDRGDLSTYYAYEVRNAEGYELIVPKRYPKKIKTIEDRNKLLRQGYAFSRLNKEGAFGFKGVQSASPLLEDAYRHVTFFLQKEGELEVLVLNGKLIQLSDL